MYGLAALVSYQTVPYYNTDAANKFSYLFKYSYQKRKGPFEFFMPRKLCVGSCYWLFFYCLIQHDSFTA
jgi:hypothetical protein